MVIPQRHLHRKWTYTNLYGLLMGLLVGHCIILINALFSARSIELENSLIVLLFSVSISLSIANSVTFMGKHLNAEFLDYRYQIASFYITCMLGMIIGTELSFLVLSIFFDFHYSWISHFRQIGVNTAISLVISSAMVLYQWQKNRFQLSSLNQEVEFLRLNRLKRQAELKTIQAKVNPHFLYNSLNAIAGLITEDGAKAEAMTLKLAQLYRYSVNHTHDDFSSIEEELRILKNYLEIEQVRFGSRFKFEMSCDPALMELKIPRFLLQPLLENAVKHGLSSKAGEAIVKLKIGCKREHLQISIYDNGSPFPVEINCGYGFKSTYDKLKLLYGTDYQIRLINHPQKHIAIQLPVLKLADTA